MKTWIKALNSYCYPVTLGSYEHSDRFYGYFSRQVPGDRHSTIEFENYFRENAQEQIEVYFEVVFWKLYSQRRIRQRTTTRILNYMLEEKTDPSFLYKAIKRFVDEPTRGNLQNIRTLLGIKTKVLAIALTFPAFLSPEKYPMVDNNVARWVNENFAEHNRDREAKLTPFTLKYTSLRENDFPNYLNWVGWCNETAQILTDKTGLHWRPRDVEARARAQMKHIKVYQNPPQKP